MFLSTTPEKGLIVVSASSRTRGYQLRLAWEGGGDPGLPCACNFSNRFTRIAVLWDLDFVFDLDLDFDFGFPALTVSACPRGLL